MHPQVLRELADVIARPLLIIFERLWQLGEVPEDCKRANVTPIFKKGKEKDPGNYRPVNIPSFPGKVMEQIILENISKHMKDKKVTGNSQHGFTKGKSCLANLIVIYNEMTSSVDEMRGVDLLSSSLVRLLTLTASHNILIDKLTKYRLDK
ncbi:mitochondrial enolase superfamily member 1 [Grus japonensis]|uniref:Mitochondrial enolase superfamily member 1 n=1 Tax=Grus japonensis TaxID=30415 RepID=A0ABC9W632_GRUJA